MERPPSETGPGLGIAAILVVVGWVFFGIVVATAASGSWDVVAITFIVAVVVWVFAFNWFAFYTSFSERRLHALLAQRDEALRRVDELRRYANFCELEAGCWPADSVDRLELLAYSAAATRQAEATLLQWREIERELRAERFEQIVSRAS